MARLVTIGGVLVLFATGLAGAAVPISPDESVLPSETDAAIRTFDYPQAVYHPKAEARGELFVLLTGTNGKAPFAKRLSTNAAMLGYHVIQPIYPNDVPAAACRNDEDPASLAVFRWAIIEGGTSPHLAQPIPRSESIEYRIVKLISCLDQKHPGKGWGQFLQGDQIVWEKVAVGGMSQGGGHAALIATKHRVARVLCFGAPKDYSLAAKRPAPWYDKSVTPAACYFTFNNVHDKQGCDYEQQLEIVGKLGLLQGIAAADVDTESSPFHGAHALFTSWPGPHEKVASIPAHVSVINDRLQGKDDRPLFRSVWVYMLTAATDRPAIRRKPSGAGVSGK